MTLWSFQTLWSFWTLYPSGGSGLLLENWSFCSSILLGIGYQSSHKASIRFTVDEILQKCLIDLIGTIQKRYTWSVQLGQVRPSIQNFSKADPDPLEVQEINEDDEDDLLQGLDKRQVYVVHVIYRLGVQEVLSRLIQWLKIPLKCRTSSSRQVLYSFYNKTFGSFETFREFFVTLLWMRNHRNLSKSIVNL